MSFVAEHNAWPEEGRELGVDRRSRKRKSSVGSKHVCRVACMCNWLDKALPPVDLRLSMVR